ncbi:cytochrome c [Acetobacter sacchari]|uniref:Cytochrome c n=1 Tax=Acetobacter sacchari TaxID=2661687 RepID=A0ABS3LUX4_9PROT|nr:cytochrome c [Acetobacter sacchari]MBO1359715.1 cytochrome c [Acetobacter sacchari]
MHKLALMLIALACLPNVAWADSADAITTNKLTTTDGRVLYQTLCQACHMADAKGAEGAAHFPALSGNPKLASSSYPAYVVANGFGGMPWFADKLSDSQIAAIVNYVRTHFGNHYTDALKPSDVTKVRPSEESIKPIFD